jgi:hypothetical protein
MVMISLLPLEIDIDGLSVGTCHRFCQFTVQTMPWSGFAWPLTETTPRPLKAQVGPREIVKELI